MKLGKIASGVLACLLLMGCSNGGKTGGITETSGIGRDSIQTSVTEMEKPEETQPAETEPEESVPPTPTVPSFTIENGKYVYSIPEPDRSTLSDLSDINAISRALFNDQGSDTTGSWYPGKTERNLTTGEVTYKWDRTKETLSIVKKYNGIYRQNEDEKVIYLTFDCGYENGWTDPILDVLKEKNAPAIFFLTGHYIDTAKPQIRRMIDEGHLLGNHTVDHINATQATAAEFISQIEGLEKMIRDNFPDAPPTLYYRPSYGACNEWSLALANKMGLKTVLWSWAYQDYEENNQMDPSLALEKAKIGLHNGAVYLFHAVGSTNAAILGDFIDYVRAQGYEIRPLMG